MTNISPNLDINKGPVEAEAKPAAATASTEKKPEEKPNGINLQAIKWHDPKQATNLPKDAQGAMRAKAEKLVNSELFGLIPKILSVFGVWFSLTGLMKIGENGIGKTIGNILPPAVITAGALGFDYFLKPMLKEFVEIPSLTPKVDLEKDICWDAKDLGKLKRTLKLFMGDTTSYLSEGTPKADIHGTHRDGLLILAGPPGNGKTAIAYGIGNLAGKPIHSLKVSESYSLSAIEEGFKQANKKGAILFIDEADAIIRSRREGVTQAFLETFNRYQRENPVRVILATNSFAEMDSAIQSRSFVFNLANPSPELKIDIFKKNLLAQGLKASAYENLINKDLAGLKELLGGYDLSGRDIGALIQDLKVVAEMRINQTMLTRDSKETDPTKVLTADEICIKLEDVKLAVEEFIQNQDKAKLASIGDQGKKVKAKVLAL